MIYVIGPAVALIGIVAVFFVMRHKSVEKRSMYSARRSQIEHKVRAARQRTMAPLKHAEKGSQAAEESASAAPTLTYEPSAYSGPPVASPPKKGHSAPAQPVWDAGPTAPTPTPSPPPFPPAAPAYEPPPYEPPSYAVPAAEAPAAEPVWTPAPSTQEPAQPEHAMPSVRETSAAGGGASWSVVGETKVSAEPERAAKKKSKGDAQTPWSLASGVVPKDDPDDGPKKSSPAIAIAQYAVLVVGLLMVLIGVLVTVANSHVT